MSPRTERLLERARALVAEPNNMDVRTADASERLMVEAADALTALQARAEDAERENERLSARNLEVSTLAHGWMVAHDNLAAGLPVTYPSPADVPASLFVCALMAAAAETTYRIGFRDAERVTDERHIDYLRGNTIAGITAAMQAPDADLVARVSTLQARVGELEGGLKPFAALYEQIVADHGEDWLPLAAGPMRASLSYPVATAPIRWADFKDAAASLTPPLEQE